MKSKQLNLDLIKSNKKVMISLVITISLALIVFLVGGRAVMAYNEAEVIKAEIAKKEADIKGWNEELAFLSKQKYRPISVKDIDVAQSALIMQVKGLNLNMLGLKAVNGNIKSGKTYELQMTGDYDNTIKFLKDFSIKDILVNIINIKMEATQGGKLKTTVKYVIYIK